jgi:hypothetical protein
VHACCSGREAWAIRWLKDQRKWSLPRKKCDHQMRPMLLGYGVRCAVLGNRCPYQTWLQ